ncbi:MAG: OmpA family protein [Hyphomicrobiaceae bacterium]|nr:OmpA family protein [Hyphomicrobiaceae bacterium]
MSQSVTKLKQLLFDNEAATLDELSRRIDALAASGTASRGELLEELGRAVGELRQTSDSMRAEIDARIEAIVARVGSDETMARSVALVLDRALVQAEEQRHDDLADAVAPVVIRTVRSEIRNSRDEIVEVLYPMTGQMVRAYVASAMKDLLAEVNRRLETNAFMLRLRAMTSGRSAGELALALSQRVVVEDLLLVRRGSGELIARWPERASNNHDHVLGGILTAINSFVSEALDDDENALRQIDLGQSQIYLRASPAYLLAAKCGGTAAASIERLIDDEFLASVATFAADNERKNASDATRAELEALAGRLDDQLAKKYAELSAPAGGISPLKLLSVVIGLPLAAWLGWTAYVRYETARVTQVASEIIQTSPEIRGYPTRLQVSPRGKAVAVTGLAPSAEAQRAVGARLKAALPSSAVDNHLAILPGAPPDTTPEIARLENELAAIKADVPRQIALRAVARARESLVTSVTELEHLASLSEGEAEGSRAAVATASEAVRASIAVADASHGVLDAGAPSSAAGDSLREGLNTAAGRLAGAANRLATTAAAASHDAPRAPRAATPPPTSGDYGESAERLAAEAQRIAVLATALTQAAVTRAAIPPPAIVAPPTPREELARYIAANAIFFGDETALRDPMNAAAHLDRIAYLMRASDAFLRVVGYTDGRGSASRNSSLSLQRANVVYNALRERGVPAERMVVLGRESSLDISPDTGPHSANRRVELEIGFNGEGGGR